MANKVPSINKMSSRAVPKLPLELCAVKLVQMNVFNSRQFAALKASKARPPEVPSRPESFYTNFPGWKKFIEIGVLGNESGLSPVSIPTYQQVKVHLRRLGISTQKEFVEAFRNKQLIDKTPRHPDQYYQQEWESWNEFLAPCLRYLNFENGRRVARSIGLKTSSDWFEFCRNGKRPSYLPSMPHRDYEEFTTWEDFLCEPTARKGT